MAGTRKIQNPAKKTAYDHNRKSFGIAPYGASHFMDICVKEDMKYRSDQRSTASYCCISCRFCCIEEWT